MARIAAEDVVVEFPIYANIHRSLKAAMLNATTGGRVARDSGNRVTVRALDGVSFDIREGDRIGLIGHNGSGKTTLLRALSGIYEPVSGVLDVQGRVSSLIDLQLGLDQDGSGYENIMLRGVLAGLRPREIRRKMEEIAEFTELSDYLEMPVRTYSSGMLLRLGFAVCTGVDADILLMDEWLSVGDAEFSKKAALRLEKLVDQTPILVLASHSPELIHKVCNRIFRLEHGSLVETKQ
jgi:lipopolysaccharide transport system ATP-binding protein